MQVAIVLKEINLKELLIIFALVFGTFSFLLVLLCMVFYNEKYFSFAFKKPNKQEISSFNFSASYSEWKLMYYVTRVLLLSASVLLAFWIIG